MGMDARQLDRVLERQPASEGRTRICTMAERMRADPDEPRPARRARPSTSDGAIMLVMRIPGTSSGDAPLRSVSPEHVVEMDAGAGHEDAGAAARRAGQRGGVAVGVEHADVRRAGRIGRAGTRRVCHLAALRGREHRAGRPRRGRASARTRACAAPGPSAARRPRAQRRGVGRRSAQARRRARRGSGRSGRRPRTAAG